MRATRSFWRGGLSSAFPRAFLSLILIVFAPTGPRASATDFTLSDSAILSLDYNLSNTDYQPSPPTILSEQDIPGTGVEFTVHFVDTNGVDAYFYRISDSKYGAGTLAGMNVGSYSNFDLQFTVLSVDGSASGSQLMGAGAFIGPFNGYANAYHPVATSLTGEYPASVISTIAVTSATVSDIGFELNLLYSYDGWSAGPHNVTFLVQPVVGLVQLPEPSTPVLVALGVGILLGHYHLRRGRLW